jgi:NAD-dependent SIR2 family protein deacetylase
MSSASSLDLTHYRQIVFLTGAGISAASGLRTYRGPGGLWKDEDVAARATAGAFARDPLGSWRLFGPLRKAAREAALEDAQGDAALDRGAESARGTPDGEACGGAGRLGG